MGSASMVARKKTKRVGEFAYFFLSHPTLRQQYFFPKMNEIMYSKTLFFSAFFEPEQSQKLPRKKRRIDFVNPEIGQKKRERKEEEKGRTWLRDTTTALLRAQKKNKKNECERRRRRRRRRKRVRFGRRHRVRGRRLRRERAGRRRDERGELRQRREGGRGALLRNAV